MHLVGEARLGGDVEVVRDDGVDHDRRDFVRRDATGRRIAERLLDERDVGRLFETRIHELFGTVAVGAPDVGRDERRHEHGDADLRSHRAKVVGEAFGESDRGELRRVVRPRIRVGEQPAHRRGVDDVAVGVLLEHAGHEAADRVDDAVEVDAEHPLPVAQRALPQQSAREHPGVVAQHVRAAMVGECSVGQPLHRIAVRDIGDDGGRSAADAFDELDGLGQRGRFDVGRDDDHPFVGEPAGERAADAAAGAGDDRRLAREVLHASAPRMRASASADGAK